jgi:hypothetical protein
MGITNDMGFEYNLDSREEKQQCGAKTRSGSPCKNYPVTSKRRCRMHGGAKGSGAQLGNVNGLKHGKYSAAARLERKEVDQLMRLLIPTGPV